MSTDLSLIELVINASVLVQIVMIVLMLASLMSWAMIFRKNIAISRAKKAVHNFEEAFWSGNDLVSIYNQLKTLKIEARGMERIFQVGFREFARLRNHESGIDRRTIIEGSERLMRAAISRELDELEQNLSFLATVGSTSPYIGLFGTVWGIMQSFRVLGNVNQATLAMVAPGISEALVATAMGLFAAIPAVIAYNCYVNEVERLANQYETFVQEFSTILQRQVQSA